MTYKWTAGRYVRTLLGSVTLLVAVGAIAREVWALTTVPGFRVEWEHVALHGLLVVTGWALVHKESLLEVLEALPVVGRAVSRMRKP